jgi:hypothetical protein
MLNNQGFIGLRESDAALNLADMDRNSHRRVRRTQGSQSPGVLSLRCDLKSLILSAHICSSLLLSFLAAEL